MTWLHVIFIIIMFMKYYIIILLLILCLYTEFVEVVAIDLDSFICEISKHIGLTWKFLARELGFSQTDIDAIEYKDVMNLKEQIYQMFHEWKNREDQNATAGRLFSAIRTAELEELLMTLREQRIVEPHMQGKYIKHRILAVQMARLDIDFLIS